MLRTIYITPHFWGDLVAPSAAPNVTEGRSKVKQIDELPNFDKQ